jgi:hypothetical protein
MATIFYDDVLDGRPLPRSIFLAGPTSRGCRTQWRLDAIAQLGDVTAIVPEFRDGRFDGNVQTRFGAPASPIPNMRSTSYNILRWETAGIEGASIVVFWMPFRIAAIDDAASLPGFTTRAEVSRELQRDPSRIVLGMPAGALSGSHIRFHAHAAGLPIYETLDETIAAALAKL